MKLLAGLAIGMGVGVIITRVIDVNAMVSTRFCVEQIHKLEARDSEKIRSLSALADRQLNDITDFCIAQIKAHQ
jgi:hypothetical protein